jgi:molecular chaperone DnaK
MLKRNNLGAADIRQVIMVGGSTYIPYVRQLVSERTGIQLAFDADPTTAIATGAAYFAGSRLSSLRREEAESPVAVSEQTAPGRRLKSVFQTVSSEEEELYMAVPEGDFEGLFYRITREDGGYDSGIRKVEKKITEFLPLQPLSLNRFRIRFLDAQHNPVAVETEGIEIMQGKFNVAGQPLPNDICLEVDDLENNSTKLQAVFERNDILPLKKTVYKEITRTIAKGSPEVLVVNVLEGSRHSRPHSNLVIGMIEIKGTDLKADLVKGSDVEIVLEMSESRDLTISAFLAMTEQEFRNVFSPSEKYVSVGRLRDDVNSLVREMRHELHQERGREEENEWMQELRACVHEGEKLMQRLSKMKDSDITDEKYEISEARRRISARYDALGKEQRLLNLREEYFEAKQFIEEQLPFVDLDRERLAADFDRVVQDEPQFLRSGSSAVLRSRIGALDGLRNRLISNTNHYIIRIFMNLSTEPLSSYTKPDMARTLIKQGEQALAAERFAELRTVTITLSHLQPGSGLEKDIAKIKGTGIG